MNIFKIIYSFAFSLSLIVAFDTLILNGQLKLLWIAIANTSNASPFSTDGQSNYILIGIFLSVGLLAYICYLLTRKKEKKHKDVEEDL